MIKKLCLFIVLIMVAFFSFLVIDFCFGEEKEEKMGKTMKDNGDIKIIINGKEYNDLWTERGEKVKLGIDSEDKIIIVDDKEYKFQGTQQPESKLEIKKSNPEENTGYIDWNKYSDEFKMGGYHPYYANTKENNIIFENGSPSKTLNIKSKPETEIDYSKDGSLLIGEYSDDQIIWTDSEPHGGEYEKIEKGYFINIDGNKYYFPRSEEIKILEVWNKNGYRDRGNFSLKIDPEAYQKTNK